MTRRTTRAVAAGIAVIAAVAAVWWWRHRAPEGFIIDLVALDDGTALVVWRANYNNDPSREWLAHFDRAGALDWSRELPGLTAQRGVLVIGDVIAVRYRHVHDYNALDEAVAGFGRRDGSQIWDRVLSPLAAGTHQGAEPITFVPAFSVAGTLIEQVTVLGERISYVLYAIDPRSGADLGHAAVPGDESDGPMAIGDRVVVHERHETTRVVETSHGIAVSDVTAGARVGCVIGDDYVILESSDLSVVAFHHADPGSRRVLGSPFVLADGFFNATTCGRHRDRMVFELLGGPLATSKTSIGIVDAHGALVAMIPMPFSSSDSHTELTRDPEVFGFAGTLPRFVPYLRIDDTKDHDFNQKLAMVDLDEARVAWVAKTELDMPDEVFRHDDRWYLDNSILGGVVMAFDGTSGTLVAAVDGGSPVQPSHIAGGTLWRFRDDWSRLDKAPLAALDAKTLASIFARGIAITDVTKQTREALGLR